MAEQQSQNNFPVLIFLTRSFKKGLANFSDEILVDKSQINDFFNEDVLNYVTNIKIFKDNSHRDGKFNWEMFLKYSNDTLNLPIEGFNGKIKRLEINNKQKNVFFFYQWFDKQISLNHENKIECIVNYIVAIFEDVKKILEPENKDFKINDLRIVLHDGDYLSMDKAKVNDDIKVSFSKVEMIEIYSYHHEPGELIFDRILNNEHISNELKGLENGQVEEYILAQFDPKIIDIKFQEKLEKLSPKIK